MATPATPASLAALLEQARACSERGDAGGEGEALDRVLVAEPRHIPALVRRADLYAAAGDQRSASSFYLMALRSAPQAGVSGETAKLLAHARQACDRFAIDYRDYRKRDGVWWPTRIEFAWPNEGAHLALDFRTVDFRSVPPDSLFSLRPAAGANVIDVDEETP